MVQSQSNSNDPHSTLNHPTQPPDQRDTQNHHYSVARSRSSPLAAISLGRLLYTCMWPLPNPTTSRDASGERASACGRGRGFWFATQQLRSSYAAATQQRFGCELSCARCVASNKLGLAFVRYVLKPDSSTAYSGMSGLTVHLLAKVAK